MTVCYDPTPMQMAAQSRLPKHLARAVCPHSPWCSPDSERTGGALAVLHDVDEAAGGDGDHRQAAGHGLCGTPMVSGEIPVLEADSQPLVQFTSTC